MKLHKINKENLWEVCELNRAKYFVILQMRITKTNLLQTQLQYPFKQI